MGMAASQARMSTLVDRRGDLELQKKFLFQARVSVANMVSGLFRAAQLATYQPAAPPTGEDNQHDEVMARVAKLMAADDMLSKHSDRIDQQHEAAQQEVVKIQTDLAANISTSFKLKDGDNQDMTQRYRGRRSDGPSTAPPRPSSPGGQSLRPSESPRPPIPTETHDESSVNPSEEPQLTQPSNRLPLWRCICWHIWFCVLSTITSSCAFGIVWSVVYTSISDAFTVASYILTVGGLVSGALMFKHNEACVQRAQRRRGESREDGMILVTLSGRSD